MRWDAKKFTPLLCLATAGVLAIGTVAVIEHPELLGQASATDYTLTLNNTLHSYFPMISWGDKTANVSLPTASGAMVKFLYSTTFWLDDKAFGSGIGGADPTYFKTVEPIHGITSVDLKVIKYDAPEDDTLPPTITFADYADFHDSYTPTIDYQHVREMFGWGISRTTGEDAWLWGATITITDTGTSYLCINFNNTSHRWFVYDMTIHFSCIDSMPQEASASGPGVTAATDGISGQPISSLPGISVSGWSGPSL